MNGAVRNKFSYRSFEGLPQESDIKCMLSLYTHIFRDAQSEFFMDRLQTKNDLLSIIAYWENTPVGFKIGYRYDQSTFYSWIGGVLQSHRQQGIATEMAHLQESWAREKKYKKLRTKSMNQYKPMMILNLKNDFDIVQIYTNQRNQTKLVFEKNL